VYQYSATLLESVARVRAPGTTIVCLGTERDAPIPLPDDVGWQQLPEPAARSWLRVMTVRLLGARRARTLRQLGRRRHGGNVRDRLARPERLNECLEPFDLDVVIYPAPHALAFEASVPAVMAVHDLQHRLQPEFPEVSAGDEWEGREYLFRNAARHVRWLLVDSEVGKEDLLSLYGDVGLTGDRICVLPFLPPPYLEDITTQPLRPLATDPVRVFYPAQFWPHKNHVRLVEAFATVRQQTGVECRLILTGTANGAIRAAQLGAVERRARELGVSDDIDLLGYVEDERMAELYTSSTVLAFPTFFGPTNIPILEAWAAGCPVLTSDIRGIREQVGDAAVLADPRSTESIAEGLSRLVTESELREHLRVRGRERLTLYTRDDFDARVAELLARL
jgi:glycosyltransferase involved in cell wall biosynthesis